MSSPENYLDPDVAYFLGLVVARGRLQEDIDRRVVIKFPYSNLIVEGVKTRFDQETQLRLGTAAIRDRLDELLEADVQIIREKGSVTILIRFLRNSIAWRNLRLHTQGKNDHIRQSNNFYGKKRRVYIEIPNQNWILPIQLCRLLQVNLSVPVQLIQWGHPNTREPKQLKKGATWAREHQLKIFAESFEPIGFHLEYKQKILAEFIEDDRKNFPGEMRFCNPNPSIRRINKKPKHPEEKSSRLPLAARKHFDCYWQICTALGCEQRKEVSGADKFSFMDEEE
jgi:hypothetical protein